MRSTLLVYLICSVLSYVFSSGFLEQLPSEVDWRTLHPSCFTEVSGQGDCYAGYAFALTDFISVNSCIQSQGKQNKKISAQELISCDYRQRDPCHQGKENLLNSVYYLSKSGVMIESCFPYESSDGFPMDCHVEGGDECNTRTFIKGDSVKQLDSEDLLMQQLSMTGPSIATFTIYSDFNDYKGGVFQHTHGKYVGLHSVLVVGYKRDGDSPYWIAKNTFGEGWGEKGYFRIKFGEGIEKNALTFDFN